ncbi:MAG TPA: phage/plasmid primase, P4 family [Gemmata sp.]|nr:phage/plasmid primase, P4 family [Gemmata sp.]
MSEFQIIEPEEDTTSKPKKERVRYEQYADAFLMDMAKEEGLRLCFYGGRFLRYDGCRYIPEQEIPHRLRSYLLKRKIPQNNAVIGNVVPIIETRTLVRLDQHPELPFWRTNEPPCEPRNVAAFRNGLIDIEKAIRGEAVLMPHTPKWVSLQCLPHDFDPTAVCPGWLTFLDETFEGDSERVALLQEWFGYCVTPDNSFQKMLCLKGVSRSGKGTIVGVLEACLGTDNITGYSLDSLSNQFGLGGLFGKLVATIGEVNLQKNPNKYTIYQNLNMVTGNDLVEIEYKYNPIKVSTRLPVRFVMCCNFMPNFADDSGALAERLMIIDFERAVPPDKRDPALLQKLVAEVSGITNWAIDGLARLRANGRFTIPLKMAATLNSYRRENSKTLGFLQDRVVIHQSLDTGNLPGVEVISGDVGCVFCDDLKKSYVQWCEDTFVVENSEGHFFKNLNQVLPKLIRKQRADFKGTMKWAYLGLRLKDLGE